MELFFIISILTPVLVRGSLDANTILKPLDSVASKIDIASFEEIATKCGYSAETKEVVTEDGYILSMFHIPGDKSRSILLVHGNLNTGDDWIIREDKSLAITLAAQNYDVWVINLRGTTYSRRHRSLDPDADSKEFFDFSFYEQAVYDLPASIDFILQETGQEQLAVLGFSIGTTALYVMGAEKPDYNDKIKVGISLAPISFVQHLRGAASLDPSIFERIIKILKLIGSYELLNRDTTTPLLELVCLNPLGYAICIDIIYSIALGKDLRSMERQFLDTLIGYFPGGTTTKLFEHLVQIIKRNKFAKFDYGASNREVYDAEDPPEFDLSKVTMKSALFMGQEDFLGTVKDSKRLNASLPNVVHYQVLPYEKFNHGDFIWGRYMSDNLYPFLLPVIEKYI